VVLRRASRSDKGNEKNATGLNIVSSFGLKTPPMAEVDASVSRKNSLSKSGTCNSTFSIMFDFNFEMLFATVVTNEMERPLLIS
jgi:hypothetical protein